MKKKALMVSTIIGFLSAFEKNDIGILQKLGYEVHVACNCEIYGSGEKLKQLLSMGMIKHHIPFARSPFSKVNIQAYKQLKSLMLAEQFDIVHCHTPVGGVLGRMAAHRCHVPVIIYTAHGFHFFKGAPAKNWMMFYPVEKWLSRFTDYLITINNEDYELAKNKFHAKKTERIHGVGIDVDKFCSVSCDREKLRSELGVSESETLLLSVGELDRDKNHIEALQSMITLAPKGYKYVIAGQGHLKDYLTEFIKEHGLQDSVQLLGYRRDIPELLQAADIYIFPSLFEGLSVALMEAVAARIPIACSEVRGNVDTVITPECYYPIDDPAKLAAVVEKLNTLSEPKKKEMADKNYQNLLKYRLSEVGKEMTQIYKAADEAVDKKRRTM